VQQGRHNDLQLLDCASEQHTAAVESAIGVVPFRVGTVSGGLAISSYGEIDRVIKRTMLSDRNQDRLVIGGGVNG